MEYDLEALSDNLVPYLRIIVRRALRFEGDKSKMRLAWIANGSSGTPCGSGEIDVLGRRLAAAMSAAVADARGPRPRPQHDTVCERPADPTCRFDEDW
jgi:hypothetical protein